MENINFIYKCAYRYSGNKLDAEDLTQDTMFSAYKNFNQLKDKNKCKSWMFSILRNNYLKLYSKNKKNRHENIEDYIEDVFEESNLDYFKEFSNEHLHKTLKTFPEKYKTPLLLFYFSDFSYKKIAEIMDIPIGTVMSRIARAKVYLRKYLYKIDNANEDKIINYNFARENS